MPQISTNVYHIDGRLLKNRGTIKKIQKIFPDFDFIIFFRNL